jgi:hypothetical protein
MEHELNHSNVEQIFTAVGTSLIIFAQTPIPSQPGKCSLNDPTPRQYLEPLDLLLAFYNLEDPTIHTLHPLNQFTCVTPIRPNQPQARKLLLDLLKNQPGSISVLDRGFVNHNGQDQSQSIDQDVTCSARYLFPCIIATRPPFSVVFTLWLSIIAALGLISRPSALRTSSRRIS